MLHSANSRPALSRRQKEIFEYILSCVKKKGFPPSIREIGQAVGLSSSSTVHSHLRSLEETGYIRRDPAKPRTIEIVPSSEDQESIFTIPILDRLEGPRPWAIKEHAGATLRVPSGLGGRKHSFLWRMTGESMKEAGILPGDLILVDGGAQVENGDIVVAQISGEPTVKRLFRGNGFIRLESDNHRIRPIIVREAVIHGKVVAVIRRF